MPATTEHYAELEQASDVFTVTNGDVEVARSSEVILLKEHYRDREMAPVPYFPPDALKVERTKTDRTTRCPIKGAASYWSIGGIENAAWSYEDADSGVKGIEGYIAFDKGKGFAVDRA